MLKIRKWSSLILALLCCAVPSALAEVKAGPVILPLPNSQMLVSRDGVPLTQRNQYSDIAPISPPDVSAEAQLFMATPTYDEVEGGLSLLLSSTGEALSDPIYDELIHENSVVRYTQGGLSGVMDASLAPLIPCRYTVLIPTGDGGYLGLDDDPYDEKPDGVYRIELDGSEIATGTRVVSGLGTFSEGLCAAVSANSGRVGYLNAQGEWAIAAQLEYGGDFKNGRAEACLESGYGIIDPQGNWLLTPKYALVSTGFGDGNIILASQEPGEVLMIDPRNYQVKHRFTGEELYFGAYFDRDYVVLYSSEDVRLIDEDGNVLMQTVRDGNFDVWFEMGDRVIARRGPWGERNCYLVDTAGQEISGPYRDIAYIGLGEDGNPYFSFCEFDVMPAQGNEDEEPIELPGTRKGGLMDKDGNVTIPMETYTDLSFAGVGLLVAETKDQIGLCDFSGRILYQADK